MGGPERVGAVPYLKRGEFMTTQKYITNWDDVPVIFDVPFAARLLGFSVDIMTRKCQKGELPAHKVFNQWRIRKDELIQFIQSK